MQSCSGLRIPSPADGVTAPAAAATRPWPAPGLDMDAAASYELVTGLVGVLGHADGVWGSEVLPRPDLIAGLRDMKLVRAFDAAMLSAHRQGKTSFYMQSLGEEAIACAHRRALSAGDMAFPTYRQQGLLVASGYPLVNMANQVYSNRADPLLGRQLPVFYSSREHGFFTVSGNLATQFVQAVGWAMAAALRRDPKVASAFIGEGATAESDFHAALQFASVYQAPVVLNIVNNQWAISSPEQLARGSAASFAVRGIGFGIPSVRADGNDFLAVYAVSAWAIERARLGHGPTVIEWVTYRRGAHSTSDDPRGYRSDDTVSPLGDPIERLKSHLVEHHGWSANDDEDQTRAAENAVAEAVAAADALGSMKSGSTSDHATMFDDVFGTEPPHLRAQREEAALTCPP